MAGFVFSLFQAPALSWKCEECGLKALGNQEADKAICRVF